MRWGGAVWLAKNAGGANAKVADDETLVYLRGSPLRRIGITSVDGAFVGPVTEPGDFDRVRWSPNGQRLLVEKWETAASRAKTIWMLDVVTGTFSRLVDGSGVDPEWAPDGRSIIFERDPPAEEGVYIAPIDGSAPVRKLFGAGFNDPTLTPDGKSLVMRFDSVGAPSRIVAASVDDPRTAREVVRSAEVLTDPAVSPDGKWVAYTAASDQDRSIYVSPMTPGGGRVRIASNRAFKTRWSTDGKSLYYYSRDGRLMSASLSFTDRGGTVGKVDFVRAAAELDLADVSPDGTRFAGLRLSAEGDTRIIVHTGWWSRVRDRMRGQR